MCKTYEDDKIYLMRVIFTLILLLSVLNLQNVFAENLNTPDNKEVVSMIQSQNIAFEDCTKMFAVNKEKLFYLTLGAISANNFSVDEIQTSNGYVIFSAANNKYLATIAGIDSANSILKITPCNNVYFFPSGILINMFKYIDINLHTEIK